MNAQIKQLGSSCIWIGMSTICHNFMNVTHNLHDLKCDLVFFFVDVFLYLNLNMYDFSLICRITFPVVFHCFSHFQLRLKN
jgi:hypothetical protein